MTGSPDPDMAHFGKALGLVAKRLATRPVEVTTAGARMLAGLAQVPGAAAAEWLGRDQHPPFDLPARDRRFADEAWRKNPWFYSVHQSYLALNELTDKLISDARLTGMTERKARLAAELILDLLAPTNFLATNPAALQRAFQTGGVSVLKGTRNLMQDVLHNNGRPRQVDASGFTIGENLAATPCTVVYRNELMELLQYQPQTAQVHARPLLCSPPWINKFYVMDLAPNRSFIEWAVKQNRTVFAISYVNPGPESAQLTMDDYLTLGPKTALDVISDITGADAIDIAGLCLGGALTAITAAYLTQTGDQRVGNLTLLNTMLDYSEPGALGMFTEAATVEALESKMRVEGTLDAASMADTFNVLRANDLIFNYVVSNWLMGQDPPAFDILAWNADSTRMPAAMHAFYLRNFYVENRLAQDTLQLGGEQIHLGNIKQDCYIVGAENDHIVPWRSAYATAGLVSGPVRFVLTSGGHIAGIVNPPGPKGQYLVGDGTAATPQEWHDHADQRTGSWWEDWADWSRTKAGELIDPPPTGSETYPVLEPGPGKYVLT
jgi:polyhydroxyalkanoate synthase